MFWINGGKVPGTKVPGSESLQELLFPGAKGPAISLQGGPGSYWRFAPGSELGRERKCCESSEMTQDRDIAAVEH